MITIEPLYRSQTDHILRSLFPGNCRPERREDRGVWCGTGAQSMFLGSSVHPAMFDNMLRGRTPTGLRKVVPNPDDPARVVAWQFNFTAPKDIFAPWGGAWQLDRPSREAAQLEAVKLTLAEFDSRINGERDSPPWEESPTAAFACFRGTPDRRQTRHLQTTAFFVNYSYRADRTFQAYTSEAVFREARDLARVYHQSLAEGLQKHARHRAPIRPPLHAPGLPQSNQPAESTADIHRDPAPVVIRRQSQTHDYGMAH